MLRFASDEASGAVWLGAKFVARLRQLCPIMRLETLQCSAQEMLSIYGKLSWASAALGINPARSTNALFLLKTMRRMCSKLNRGLLKYDDFVTLSRAATAGMHFLFNAVKGNEPAVVNRVHESWSSPQSRESFDHILVTDATPVSYGVVLLTPGQLPTACGGKFESEIGDINLAEISATLFAVDLFAERIKGKRILVRVGNTSALSALRGGAKAEQLVAISEEIRMRLPGTYVRTEFVASRDNIADMPSRCFNGAEISNVPAWATSRRGSSYITNAGVVGQRRAR